VIGPFFKEIEQSAGGSPLTVAQAHAIGYGETMRKLACRQLFPAIGFTVIALLAGGAAANAASEPRPRRQIISCPFLAAGHLTIDVPANRKSLPKIDFDYPSKATQFSFRDKNLFLIAVDEASPSRLRIVISAQLNKKRGTYDGQIFTDTGGNQLMLDNGPVRCSVGR
jgi:hypothetical protein